MKAKIKLTPKDIELAIAHYLLNVKKVAVTTCTFEIEKIYDDFPGGGSETRLTGASCEFEIGV